MGLLLICTNPILQRCGIGVDCRAKPPSNPYHPPTVITILIRKYLKLIVFSNGIFLAIQLLNLY